MFDKTIEDLVCEYVNFTNGLNSKGWRKVFCEVCGDGTHAKGPRGGWYFENETCVYHCFNCGVTGNFDPNREFPLSKEMSHIFDSFGIPSKEYYTIGYAKKLDNNQSKKVERKKVEVATIDLPDYFYKLEDGNKENIIVQKAYAELEYRNIDPSAYTFYLSNGRTKGGPRDEAIAKAMMNRLIIPFFDSEGNLIYYQGRAFHVDNTVKNKYINADIPKTNILYGMDKLHTNTANPLYFTEGFFDAFHLKGVSIQENNLTASQIELLKKSPRKKVWVPDRKSDSSKVVDQCIKLGWHVSVPNIGSQCKDIDDAVRKYGKLYTVQQVASNIYPAEDAKIMMQMYGYLT
jgi:hypothetical protein